VLIGLKAVKVISRQHVAQCMNYLRATNTSLCLLINFGCPARKSADRPRKPDQARTIRLICVYLWQK
jgi:GxxExxY protein